MIALFVFNDGVTKLMDIPSAHPYYYFPVYRSSACDFKSATLEDELRRGIITTATLKRVAVYKDFLFYDEQ